MIVSLGIRGTDYAMLAMAKADKRKTYMLDHDLSTQFYLWTTLYLMPTTLLYIHQLQCNFLLLDLPISLLCVMTKL